MNTGRRKANVCSTYTPPGVPSMRPATVDRRLAESIPCATRCPKRLAFAYSASTCSGYVSPLTAAKSRMSASVIVLANVTASPTANEENSRGTCAISKTRRSGDETEAHAHYPFCDSPGPPVLTADAEFRAVANAAFAAWQQQPPYVAYRVDVNVNVSALKKSRRIERAVETRTRDNLAVLQDLPQGQNQL